MTLEDLIQRDRKIMEANHEKLRTTYSKYGLTQKAIDNRLNKILNAFDNHNDLILNKDIVEEIQHTSNTDLLRNVLEAIEYNSDSAVNVHDEDMAWLNFARKELELRLINLGFYGNDN